MTLNWTEKVSNFSVNGQPVKLHSYTVETPLGLIKAYESINGNCVYASWPYKVHDTEEGLFIGLKRMVECKSIEEAKQKCTEGWIIFRNACFNVC